MNSASFCHEIPGCRGLFVDAFRGSDLKKTRSAANSFILTHYHGDHYGNLPRDNKYQGPALIHCTPVTAALLRHVHNVPSSFVVEHAYGETFHFRAQENTTTTIRAKITFYDANHCPGAAIVLIELTNGRVHLHTGDMRFHHKMKSYPLLREAAMNKKVDTVLLDTTYGNPKHDFVPQEAAVDSIASLVHGILGSLRSDEGKTLVLLSCYSIGKEKVLWEVSNRCNQQLYVTERKLQMLQCIQGGHEEVSSQIIHRCTRQAENSDIHVVPMGVAGEMWPFFRPNFGACAQYARDLSRDYNKVIAFIPTGWADATNWNKKNAVSRSTSTDMDVEIRLIAYSEHSSFQELQSFVDFIQPRKVVPTVFKDENDARKIEARFPIDITRAKQHFINKMFRATPSKADGVGVTSTKGAATTPPGSETSEEVAEGSSLKRKREKEERKIEQHIATLREMGFTDRDAVARALADCCGNIEAATEMLLTAGTKQTSAATSKTVSTPTSQSTQKKNGKSSPCEKLSQKTITKFFTPK